MNESEEKQFKEKVLSAYRNNRLFFAVVLIIGSIAIGIIAAPIALNYYLDNSYPVYEGKITPGYQYLIEGTIIGYDINGSSIAVQTDYGIIDVSILDMKNRIGYKICQHTAGAWVKYIILINGDPSGFGNMQFLLMREIC